MSGKTPQNPSPDNPQQAKQKTRKHKENLASTLSCGTNTKSPACPAPSILVQKTLASAARCQAEKTARSIVTKLKIVRWTHRKKSEPLNFSAQ